MFLQIFLILILAILIIIILELDKIKKSITDLMGRAKDASLLNRLSKPGQRHLSNSWWSLETPDIRAPLKLLKSSGQKFSPDDVKRLKEIIEKALRDHNIKVETINEPLIGPRAATFSFKPAAGVQAAEVLAVKHDLASELLVHPIKIEAPISGTDLIGVEVPYRRQAGVSLGHELETDKFINTKNPLTVPFGRDSENKQRSVNLHNLPHLLIGGAAGSGKSVFINSLIISLMTKHSPRVLRFILADSKRVDLTVYNSLPYLLTPVITTYQKIINALDWCSGELDLRLKIFAAAEMRNLEEYNKDRPEKLPYIIFILAEISDFCIGDQKKILAGKMIKLLQLGRAGGLHLVAATSKPGDELFSGALKANFPARLALAASSEQESREILNTGGAERLSGKGEALFINAEMSQPVRLQLPYVGHEIIKNVVDYFRGQSGNFKPADVIDLASSGDDLDELLETAKSLVIEEGHASISLLQRKLRIEYARASYILDQLENFGVIGPASGANPREVFITPEMYKKMKKRAALENANPALVDDMLGEAKELVIKSGHASAAYLERKLNISYARSARLLDLMEEQGVIGPGAGALPRKVINNNEQVILAGEASLFSASAKKMNFRILHFEDDGMLAKMYGAKFEKAGFAYVNYGSPSKNPVAVVLKEKPDLIIMDIIMPVMDGFTAAEILKSHAATKKIPIVGLCNMSQQADVARAAGLSMIDYFVKQHFIPGEIVEKIKDYFKDPKSYKPIAFYLMSGNLRERVSPVK